MKNGAESERYARGMEHLLEVVQSLSLATDLATVVDIVRKAARALTGADGATFVLRDGERCYYVDEDAIGPLWRGQRFPLDACISGWAMKHAQAVVLEDIYADARIPADAYRPTFVKSLVMVPIRAERPIGAIGNYWATHHRATEEEVRLLQSLAHSTSVALRNVELIGDLRASLEETKRARDELERQLRLRDDFIALASHELRTPLTPLELQMHVLERTVACDGVAEGPAAARIGRAVAVSGRQVADLRRLTEHMLDASRISLGRLEVAPTDGVDLGAVARGAVAELGGDGVRVDAEEGVVGRWDAARLGQVALHLLDNARKFGEGRPIDVEVRRDGAHARLTVRDRGVGIDPRDHGRIFERFERAAPIDGYRGLGLGLFAARAVVEAHGGRLTVASARGEGSAFTVELPCA